MQDYLENLLPFDCSKVIIFRNAKSAEYFLDTLYNYSIDLIVVSADGVYPKNQIVKEKTFETLKTDHRINVFLLGKDCISYVPDIKTRKIFLLDELLEYDLQKSGKDKFNFSPSNFMYLIHTLSKSRSVTKMSNSTIDNNLVSKLQFNPFEYDKENNRLVSSWKAQLLGCNETLEIEPCDFATAKKVWASDLWKDRDIDDIEPVNTMIPDNNYNIIHNKEIKNNDSYFFVVKYKNNIIGINSGHKCSDDLFRSRGLWTHPDWREIGIGKLVLEATVRKAKLLGCTRIWSFPRKSSIYAYKSVGFKQKSDWTDRGLFGPNCIVEINFNE